MTKVSIIIPAYNEEKRIEKTLKNIALIFKNETEIIVVSNGSTDKTIEILKSWKSKNIDFRYLDFTQKMGKGGAIIEGLKIAKGEIIGFIDADDAFDLEYIKQKLEELNKVDCIIASKWKNQNFFQVDEPFLRKLLSRGWNLLVRVLLNLQYKDTQAGAKFFRKEVKDRIGANFISKGFAFDVDLLKGIKDNNFKIKEIYIPSKYVEGSTFRLRHCKTMFKDLIKIWGSK